MDTCVQCGQTNDTGSEWCSPWCQSLWMRTNYSDDPPFGRPIEIGT